MALAETSRQLNQLPGSSSALEAKVLLCHLLQKNDSYLYTWPERRLEESQWQQLRQLIRQRLAGEPIAYITGQREFWSLMLKVTPATLIPRPETEQLVERALQHLPGEKSCRIADLGTGTGAIAAALASERPHWQITASDHSREALAVARENFQTLELHNVTTCQGDWCEALPTESRFDIIISNPPYIADSDPHLKQGDLPSEPYYALASGHDGLDAIRQIVQQAPHHLKRPGHLLLEHGFDQGTAVRKLLSAAGFELVSTHRDLSGLNRISEGTLTKS